MTHQHRQIGLPRVEHEVIVIAHQTVGQHLRVEPVHPPLHDCQKVRTVRIVHKDRLAPVATRSDVIHGAGKLDS